MVDRPRALALLRRLVLFLVLELSLGLLLFLVFLFPQLSRDFRPTPLDWGAILAFLVLYIFLVYFALLGPGGRALDRPPPHGQRRGGHGGGPPPSGPSGKGP